MSTTGGHDDDITVTDIMSSSSSPQEDSESAGLVTTNMSADVKRVCAVCGDSATGKHYGIYRHVRYSTGNLDVEHLLKSFIA